MQRRIFTARPLRTGGWALALAAGLTIAAGSSAGAAPLPTDGLPLPLPSSAAVPVPLPTTPPALPGPLHTLIGTLTGPLTGATVPAPAGTGSAGSGTGGSAVPALPGGVPTGPPTEVTGPLSGVGTQLKSGLNQLKAGAAGTPLGTYVPDGSPGSVLSLAVNASPLATACVQVTGSGTAVANTTINVGGQDISAPLVRALPGVLAACPAGTIPSTQGVDGSIGGLVGLCVRANEAPPLKATILALDTDILGQLTAAGIPLQQIVVPCPNGTPGTTRPGGGHSGGGTRTGGSAGHDGSTTGAHGGAAGSSNDTGSGNGSDCTAANASSSGPLNMETMGNLLPHSPASALPWLLLTLIALAHRRIGRVARTFRIVRA